MSSGIPTTYKNIRFRSRLEARWAAFFDRCGWKWSYEPLDLAGYIPDFLLHFETKDLLVEVKPNRPSDDLEAVSEKIHKSGWRGSAVILCASWDEESAFSVRIGAAATSIDEMWGSVDGDWGEALLADCGSCGGPAIIHTIDWPTCLRCGFSGSNSDDDIPPLSWVKLRLLNYNLRQRWWAESGNEVQWKPQA